MEISSEIRTVEKNVWNNILQSVEKRLNRHIFDAWFRPIQFEGCDENEKILRLRTNEVTKDWINSNYTEVISQTMRELNLSGYRLDWEIEEAKEELYTDDDIDFFFDKQTNPVNTNGEKNSNYLENSKKENSAPKATMTRWFATKPIC